MPSAALPTISISDGSHPASVARIDDTSDRVRSECDSEPWLTRGAHGEALGDPFAPIRAQASSIASETFGDSLKKRNYRAAGDRIVGDIEL